MFRRLELAMVYRATVVLPECYAERSPEASEAPSTPASLGVLRREGEEVGGVDHNSQKKR